MTPELQNRIKRMREALSLSPIGVLAGKVRPGVAVPEGTLSKWGLFRDLLVEADGGRYGSIDIWALTEISSKQYPSVDFPGENNDWLVFGQLLYDPLALRSGSESVFLFRGDSEPSAEEIGEFDSFLEREIFGPGYREIIPGGEQDEWWSILGQAGLLDEL